MVAGVLEKVHPDLKGWAFFLGGGTYLENKTLLQTQRKMSLKRKEQWTAI
jgi:hypothetical protein